MRLAALADIHGNLPALEAVLADIEQLGADGIVVAGDLAYGPQMAEAAQRLHDLGACMVRGNNDQDVLDYGRLPADHPQRHARQFACLRWQHAHLPAHIRDLLAALPEQRVIEQPGRDPIRVVHGSPRRPTEMLFPRTQAAAARAFREVGFLPLAGEPPGLEEPLAGVREPVLVCGHTHIPWLEAQDGRLAFNPGSVGAPLNGDPRAQYAMLAWAGGRWHVTHRAVPYDLSRIRAAYQESGLLAEGGGFARGMLLWVETGRLVSGRLLRYACRLVEEAGLACEGAVPDEIWDRAVATFDWPADDGRLGLRE